MNGVNPFVDYFENGSDMSPKLSVDQRHVLTRYRQTHKNAWKSRLRALWSGPQPWAFDFGPQPRSDEDILYDLKETHGEAWLRDASITSIRIEPLPRNASAVLGLMRAAPVLEYKFDPDGVTVWHKIDMRRARDLARPMLGNMAWGGILGSLKKRSLYEPHENPHSRAKIDGYGWVRVLRAAEKAA